MNCIEDCSNAFLFQCHADERPEHSYRVLKPLQEIRLPGIAFSGPEKISIVCPLPHCRCITNILWTSGNVSVDVHKTVDMDVQRHFSSFQKSCPTEEMGPFPGKCTGARISLAVVTGVVFARAHRGCAEGRLHFGIEIKCRCF